MYSIKVKRNWKSCLSIFGGGLLISISSLPTAANEIERFETYSSALQSLFVLGGNAISFGFGENPQTNCGFTNIASDITNPGIQDGPIGVNLSRHCIGSGDISAGSVLGGSLSSAQSTRSVSQFNLRSRRAKRARKSRASSFSFVSDEYFIGDPIESSLLPDAGINKVFYTRDVSSFSHFNNSSIENTRVLESSWSVFTDIVQESAERIATQYETGFESERNQIALGFSYKLARNWSLGVRGTASKNAGDFLSNDALEVDSFGEMISLSYSASCGQSSGGEFEQNEFGVAVFTLVKPSVSSFILAEIGVDSIDRKYSKALCLQSQNGGLLGSPPVARQVFSGKISASPSGLRADALLRGGYDIAVGPTLLGIRASANFFRLEINSYDESETAVLNGSSLLFENAVPVPTGSALTYEKQSIDSTEIRMGFIFVLPMTLGNWLITPYVEATLVQGINSDPHEPVVNFVEDGRVNPTRFSFKTDAPDSDYEEYSGGVSARLDEKVHFYIGGLKTRNHDFLAIELFQAGLTIGFN